MYSGRTLPPHSEARGDRVSRVCRAMFYFPKIMPRKQPNSSSADYLDLEGGRGDFTPFAVARYYSLFMFSSIMAFTYVPSPWNQQGWHGSGNPGYSTKSSPSHFQPYCCGGLLQAYLIGVLLCVLKAVSW